MPAARVQKNSPLIGTEVKCKKLKIITEPPSITFKEAMKACKRTKADLYGAIGKRELNWMAPEEVAQKLVVVDKKYETYKNKCQDIDKKKAAKASK